MFKAEMEEESAESESMTHDYKPKHEEDSNQPKSAYKIKIDKNKYFSEKDNTEEVSTPGIHSKKGSMKGDFQANTFSPTRAKMQQTSTKMQQTTMNLSMKNYAFSNSNYSAP